MIEPVPDEPAGPDSEPPERHEPHEPERHERPNGPDGETPGDRHNGRAVPPGLGYSMPPWHRPSPMSIPALDRPGGVVRFPLSPAEVAALVRMALEEDGAFNDITTIATVVSARRARGAIVARRAGTVCGVLLALETFQQMDPKAITRTIEADGEAVEAGSPVLFIRGHARGMLSAERVALNFMQHLSGIATLTAQFVAAVRGTNAKILDTRKTLPGWRALEKYAVRCGGGQNHRMDLASAVLIKDNHLAAVDGDVGRAIARARMVAPAHARIEIECDTIEQVEAAVAHHADIVLLDNMTPAQLAECVHLVNKRAIVEASGRVRLENVRQIAETGVDWISAGSLTHSPPALDLALDFE
jgi:nicotinate-nucleotide pyrophosphorylase (carboxylating)